MIVFAIAGLCGAWLLVGRDNGGWASVTECWAGSYRSCTKVSVVGSDMKPISERR